MAPRFSPDGSRIAFSANYDGNTDVYVVPTLGGPPTRLTHHPMGDRVVDRHPDGTRVLFVLAAPAAAAAAAGPPPPPPPPPPGPMQFAYLPQSQAARTWKRYRGGWAPDIRVFNLRTLRGDDDRRRRGRRRVPDVAREHDLLPVLTGVRRSVTTSGRSTGATGAVRQVTDFRDVDIAFPALGPNDIVFQAGGRLYLLDLTTEKAAEVPHPGRDRPPDAQAARREGGRVIWSTSVSPTGKRAVFEASG